MTNNKPGETNRLFMSEGELAKTLGVDKSTLSRLAKSGELPVKPRLIGTRRIYSRAEILDFAGVKTSEA